MASRAGIEQAKGMIMLGYGCDSATAFELLTSASQRGNVKLRELAEGLVAAVQNPPEPLARTREYLESVPARLTNV